MRSRSTTLLTTPIFIALSYSIAERSTYEFEEARVKVQKFLNAAAHEEIIFVRNATEGINLVAQAFGRLKVRQGDEILVSAMEHHANIVPWQMLCEEKGASLKVIPINDDGELLMQEYAKLLSERTKLVGIVHMSNALGTVNPVEEIIKIAHERGVPVLVDGAQSAYHRAIDVQKMDCVISSVFSGHKLYGPTGNRSALRQAQAFRGDASLAGWRRYDHLSYL